MRMRKEEFWAALLLVLCLLTGCGQQEEAPPTLWVVTEKTEWDEMNFQARAMGEVFQESHPGWEVRLDILPTDETERSRYLQQIRTWMMAGQGPDVFLLPTSDNVAVPKPVIWYEPWLKAGRYLDREPLFADVEQAMGNGVFADLSARYDADRDLGRDRLQQQIMDAGCFRGGRYILPLRYNFPVLYTDPARLEEYGLSMEDVEGNLTALWDMAIASGSRDLAASVEPYYMLVDRSFSMLPQLVDRENERITVTRDQLTALFTRIQALEALAAGEDEHRLSLNFGNFFNSHHEILSGGFEGWVIEFRKIYQFPTWLPMHAGTLDEALEATTVSIASKHPYPMIPLRGIGGELNAWVTYYGAVSASSAHVTEAYDYLRLFLTARAQYEFDTPTHASILSHGMAQRLSLIEEGWPVRVRGGTNSIYDIIRASSYFFREDSLEQYNSHPKTYKVPPTQWTNVHINKRKLISTHLEDGDIPLLRETFDHVYFGSALEQELSRMIRSLNDPATGAPTDADIDALAEDFIKKLEWQILEG